MLSIFISCLYGGVSAQTNLDFEQGLAGWNISGKVSPDGKHPHNGSACARITEGSIFKRLPVSPLAVVQFECYIRSERKGIAGYSFIRFYNVKHQKLLEYKSKALDSVAWQQTGNYTESPASSSYMEIGVEKDSSTPGDIYLDDFTIEPNVGEPKIKHSPEVDLNRYMRPFWDSDTIWNETVLLYSADGKPADGRLLYMPDHIISVKSFDLKNTYTEGTDYTLSGNTIMRTANSAMPYRADTSFDLKKDLNWYNTQLQWVVITYTHHDKWSGPVPLFKGNQLPLTMLKLRAKKPLRIAAYGMSITRGMDVSSYDTVPPYMPTYVDLFAWRLRRAYHDSAIKMYNAGLPGSRVDWGAQYAEQYINPLKPDLVIIDFGMNDFWALKPEQFKTYIETIMRKIRKANPGVEFILLSNMKFDPTYVLDSDKYKPFYTGN
ncbi:MAG: SGNH/GDSL hydrolase family protein, partial [Bacteroidetes bacterium]|nr:SGNH/GDSL hydrolase family protein [Bacteroidota bacterium]